MGAAQNESCLAYPIKEISISRSIDGWMRFEILIYMICAGCTFLAPSLDTRGEPDPPQ